MTAGAMPSVTHARLITSMALTGQASASLLAPVAGMETRELTETKIIFIYNLGRFQLPLMTTL